MAKKKAPSVFDTMAIDEWLDYIEKNGKTDDEKRELKVSARRSLTVENMAAYISKHDNKPAAKKAFKNAALYTAKDKDGNVLVDDDGNIVERMSVINAASYFVEQYIPELKVGEKKKASAFDIIADW